MASDALSRSDGFSWEFPKDANSIEALAELEAGRVSERLAAIDKQIASAAEGAGAAATPEATGADARCCATAREMRGDALGAVDAARRAVAATRSAAPAPAQTVAALLTLAGTSARIGDRETVRESLAEAMDVAGANGLVMLSPLALIQTAGLALVDRMVETVLPMLSDAFALGRAHGLTKVKGHVLTSVGCAYASRGDLLRAERLLQRAQLLCERAGDVVGLGRVYNNLGCVQQIGGHHVNAIPYFERSIEILASSADLTTIINVLSNNARAFELAYIEQAPDHRFRGAAARVVRELNEPSPTRAGDFTVVSLGIDRFDDLMTYSSDPIVGGPMMLLPTVDYSALLA